MLDNIGKNKISILVNSILNLYHNRDPFFLARQIGIEYRFIELNDELLAFSVRSSNDDIGTIYISNHLGTYSKKILCAHELGHLFLHANDDANLFDHSIDPIKEYQANYFAAKLLPQIAGKNIDSLSVEELNALFANKLKSQNWAKPIEELINNK